MNRLDICGRTVVVTGDLLRIANLDADKYHFIADPCEIVDTLRKQPVRVDVFSFLAPLNRNPDLLSYPMEWDNLAVLRVSSFDEWWSHQVKGEVRNRAKQAAKKGLVVREVAFDENLARGIWKIYNECPVRQGRPFPHYGKPFETVYREAATYLDWSVFIGAFVDDTLVGFAKLVADERGSQANFMNILSMTAHRDRAPTNALVAQAVRTCVDRGYQYLVYQNFVYGSKGVDGLTKFKEVNGFRRIEVPRYFVPLTGLGRIAIGLGLHQRILDRIPSSIAGKMRAVRDAWYVQKARRAMRSV